MGTTGATRRVLGAGTLETFPEIARPRLAELLAELNGLLDVREATPRGGDPIRESALREALSTCGWQLAETITWARTCNLLPPHHGETGRFTDDELLVLDAGFLAEGVAGVSCAELLQAMSAAQPGPVPVELMHDCVQSVARKISRVSEIEELKGRIARKQEEVGGHEIGAARTLERQELFLRSLAKADELLYLQASAADVLEGLAMLKSLPPRDHTSDTFRQEKRLMEGWNRLRAGQGDLIETYAERRELADLQKQYLALLTAAKKAELELDDLHASVEAAQRECANLSAEAILASVREEFTNIRNILLHANKQDQRAVPQFFLDAPPTWLPAAIGRQVAEILESDKRLASAWASGKWNKPRVRLVPGTGPACYSKIAETVWVPIVTRTEVGSSLRRALGLHRFYQARPDQESFQQLDPYRAVKDLDALAEAFAAAYDNYLGLEIKGFRKLPTDVSKWFRLHLMQPA